MLGNFTYCNPTKLYFGEDSLSNLGAELKKYGQNVVLIYGGGSIKKNGIYDEVMAILKEEGKNITEIAGVMPNPTLEKLYEGVEIARNHKADFLLVQRILHSFTAEVHKGCGLDQHQRPSLYFCLCNVCMTVD